MILTATFRIGKVRSLTPADSPIVIKEPAIVRFYPKNEIHPKRPSSQNRVVELRDTFGEEHPMSHATGLMAPSASESLPAELVELKERVQAQPAEVRAELEPMVDE